MVWRCGRGSCAALDVVEERTFVGSLAGSNQVRRGVQLPSLAALWRGRLSPGLDFGASWLHLPSLACVWVHMMIAVDYGGEKAFREVEDVMSCHCQCFVPDGTVIPVL